uniref:(California timema) hypothetical protein n=1 Tax=Timema californicum TaxID=61474 RepID=A0A7R9JJD7_TIMCA|nr:unnamed protein product [Timema californicum]
MAHPLTLHGTPVVPSRHTGCPFTAHPLTFHGTKVVPSQHTRCTSTAHPLNLHGTPADPPRHTGCPSTAHSLTFHGGRAADMEDILIVSSRDSQAAALWVNYLTTCFNQISKQRNRPPFK